MLFLLEEALSEHLELMGYTYIACDTFEHITRPVLVALLQVMKIYTLELSHVKIM